eukprot:765663_1
MDSMNSYTFRYLHIDGKLKFLTVEERDKLITFSFLNTVARTYNTSLIDDITEIIFLYYHRSKEPFHWAFCTPDIGISFASSHPVSKHTNNVVYWQGCSDKNYRGNAMCNYWIKANTERHVYIIKSIGPIHWLAIGLANHTFNIKKHNYLEFVDGKKMFEVGWKGRSIQDDDVGTQYEYYWKSRDVFKCFNDKNKLEITMKLVINSNSGT